MENHIAEQFNQLDGIQRAHLRTRLSKSPKALQFIRMLEQSPDRKFKPADFIDALYPEKIAFETKRNRYFKLRKHIYTLLQEQPETATVKNSGDLLPYEQALFSARELIGKTHYSMARKALNQLLADCTRDNIFELLPEIYSQLAFCQMALNDMTNYPALLNNMLEATNKLGLLRKAQYHSRMAYATGLRREFGAVKKHIQALLKIAQQHPGSPRFRMCYYFSVMNYTNILPDLNMVQYRQQVGKLKQYIIKYPGMPAAQYEPGWEQLLRFYLHHAEAVSAFFTGDFHTAHRGFVEASEILEKGKNLRIRKTESFFINKIMSGIAVGNFTDALATAEALIAFQKDQKKDESRFKGYEQITIIYTYAYPVLKCPNPEFYIARMDEYTSLLKKTDPNAYARTMASYGIFLFICGRWKKAKAIARMENCRKVFRELHLDLYIDLLEMNPATPKEKIKKLEQRLHTLLQQDMPPDQMHTIKRVEQLLEVLKQPSVIPVSKKGKADSSVFY
jgi:hypothetical protein